MTLEEKIRRLKEALREESEEEMARFDVKKAGEDGVPNCEAYLIGTKEVMRDRFPCPAGGWDSLEPWQKLCCYKVSDESDEYKGVDCDTALRSTVIYQLAFGYGNSMKIEKYGKGRYQLEHGGLILRGDTMNSYATTVRQFLKTCPHDPERVGSFLGRASNGKWGVLAPYTDMCGTAHWDAAVLGEYDYFKSIIPPASEDFYRLCHTAGNFIPVPPAFQSRGGRGSPTCDYWDLALLYIYQDRLRADDTECTLERLAGSEKRAWACRSWLDECFGKGQDGWDAFVERNFLQDFVGGKERPYGPPRQLWRGHFEGAVMPQRGVEADGEPFDQFSEFFTHAAQWMAARGLRIAKAVQDALRAEEQGAAAD